MTLCDHENESTIRIVANIVVKSLILLRYRSFRSIAFLCHCKRGEGEGVVPKRHTPNFNILYTYYIYYISR
jgi:hypothetical protein